MPHSEDFGFDDDDSGFIAAATQAEASQHVGDFETSPRPTKRRRIRRTGLRQVDGASSDELGWSESDAEAHSPAKQLTAGSATQARTASDDEPEEDSQYYFPGELQGQDERTAKTSKYKIHAPKEGGYFQDQIFTQTQVGLDSSPSHFRGAVWKKTAPPPPPLFNRNGANGVAKLQRNGISAEAAGVTGRQRTLIGLNGFAVKPNGAREKRILEDDAQFAARLQAEEDSRVQVASNGTKKKSPSDSKPPLSLSNELDDLPSDAFSSSSPEKSPEKDVIMISSQATASQAQPRGLRGPQQGLKQMTIFGQAATQEMSASQAAKKKHAWPLTSRDEPPTHHKLEDKAMETWVYPTNLGTIRDYQYNIVSRSLFHNTLVALPTGLGKTFIAATVMLNYYRWTKDAQIVFMAPTKPLIAQQMDACFHIVGIPRRDTVLMTGETQPALRAEEWLEKRVFFMTPQTVINDLKTGICDPKKIVLVVVDEAHKASGGYAYTEVVKFLHRFNPSFRVHALTATPGSTVEAVQGVIDALGIARVELRTEQSLDIREYTHEKHTDTETFEFSDEQAMIMELFTKALRPVLDKLCQQNAYWSRDPMQLTAYGLTTARQKWNSSDAGRKAAMPVKGMVNSIFTTLSSLAHGISLLKFHGIAPFYSSVLEFQKTVESGQSKGKYPSQIAQSEDFVKMTRLIRGWTNNPDFIGHPKLQYLREVVLNHFLDTGEGMQGPNVPPSATRVMVFASFRDSTEEICRVLKRNEPMIRPHVFVGQAASKGSEGMDQKRQNAVIQDFKSGKYNTLVATSIGEEGLDIGDVDLIVCYDASSSPIRMLQRIGRTGRKRMGRVTLLLMKDKEEKDYAKAQDNYAYIQKSIADATKYTYRDEQSPRIFPKGVQPVVDKRVIEIPIENSPPIDLNEKGKRAKGKAKLKRPPKKFYMPDGVKTGFVKASRMGSRDDEESEEEAAPKSRKPAPKKRDTPAKKTSKRAPEPELEPMQLPFLEDVLLSNEQQMELDRKYARTANDEGDLTVRAPDPTRHPERLKALGASRYVRHGKMAHVVERTMDAISEIDGDRLERWKAVDGFKDLLLDAGEAKGRLVSPALRSEENEEDEDLPERPFSVRKPAAKDQPKKTHSIQRTTSIRSAASAGTEEASLPSVKKPTRGRPKKKNTIRRTTSIRSAATAETDELPTPAAVAKKPRGRLPKKAPIRRADSYGSAAAEGASSSPEPTPANMRIATQGIDLGSNDTSGEDDDEESDSELEDFVVRSDQPIEMASSSQKLPDESQSSKANPRSTNAATRSKKSIDDDGEQSDDDESGLGDLDAVEGRDDSDVEEIVPPKTTAALNRRKKRVVRDSDSDE